MTELDLELTLLGPAVTQIFDVPKSDLELEMSVPGICGPVTYILTLDNGPVGSTLEPTLD